METNLSVEDHVKGNVVNDTSSKSNKRTKIMSRKNLPSLPEDGLFQPNTNTNKSLLTIDARSDDSHIDGVSEKKTAKKASGCLCCCGKVRCHPPPALPQPLRRFLSSIYKLTGGIITYIFLFLLIYALFWVFTGPNAMPPTCVLYKRLLANSSASGSSKMGPAAFCSGGNSLSIIIFYAFAFAIGQVTELFRLPGLLGMLLSGLILRCISVFSTDYEIFNYPILPSENIFTPVLIGGNSTIVNDQLVIFAALLHVDKTLSAFLRQIALSTILTRAGLGLEFGVLRQVFTSVVRLTFMPCLTEATVATVASKYLIGWPWPWAAMLGFVLAAVSPAVVVPSMMRLEIAGWGVAHGIPTLIMAASSLDDVVAITGFGIALSIAFAHGNIAFTIIMGPVEVITGAISGFLLSMVLWVFPPPAMEHGNVLRGAILYSISIASIVGTVKMGLPGGGALCVLVFSFSTSMGWQHGLPWRFRLPKLTRQQTDNNNDDTDQFNDEKDNGTMKNEHHQYYHQGILALKRLVIGDKAKDKNALAAVSRTRRFSLPEPKPGYEMDDFKDYSKINDEKNEGSHTLRGSKVLQRSLSSRRPSDQRWRTITDSQTSPTPQNTDNNAVAPPTLDRISPFRTDSMILLDRATTHKQRIAVTKFKGLECLKIMRSYMATAWWFVQPLLFCLIGADIAVEKLRPDVVGRGIAALLIALCFRLAASVLAVTPSPLRFKERIFVALAWMPKATVQAAIGSLALDQARLIGNLQYIDWGEQILTLAALSILITAPLGAALMMVTAPCLLEQDRHLLELPNKSSTSSESTDEHDEDNKSVDSKIQNIDVNL